MAAVLIVIRWQRSDNGPFISSMLELNSAILFSYNSHSDLFFTYKTWMYGLLVNVLDL